MSAPRRVFLAGAMALAVLAPCVPAAADSHNPTPAELRAARARVVAARHRVASLQDRAEAAAEAYNGATVRALKALRIKAEQDAFAAQAQGRYDGALAIAHAAQSVAHAATARATAAEAAHQAMEAQAAAAQLVIDRLAVGAFRTDGRLGMLSQLITSSDPIELANGRNLIGRMGAYQTAVIRQAQEAKARAQAAATLALDAQTDALVTARAATKALDNATVARDGAAAARDSAVRAADAAMTAVQEARSAKKLALSLVAQAEAVLGNAQQRAASLAEAAREARAAAGQYKDIDAPSDQARIAIHWAFEEIGVPYSWGGGDENGPTYGFAQGAGTKGFDCSGLTLFAYGKAGIHLDHYTGSQWNQGKRISSRADLLPGDLMFFAHDTSNEATIHHVSIYIGHGRMIEAPYTGEVVRVSSADRDDFIGATRPWA